MRREMAIRAPFTGVEGFKHKSSLWLTKAIFDKRGKHVRYCGAAIDIHAMAEEMNMRAAEFFMVEGTAADPDLNTDIHKPFVKYDSARYRK